MMIDTDTIQRALADVPAWAKIALTVPSERLREDASREVAQHLYSALYAPEGVSPDQLALPLTA